ncbi:hypothetical protein D3C73_879090 [compost metagenome]
MQVRLEVGIGKSLHHVFLEIGYRLAKLVIDCDIGGDDILVTGRIIEKLRLRIDSAGERAAGEGELAVGQRQVAFAPGLGAFIDHRAENAVQQGWMQIEVEQIAGKVVMQRKREQDLCVRRAGKAEVLLGEIPAAFEEVILLGPEIGGLQLLLEQAAGIHGCGSLRLRRSDRKGGMGHIIVQILVVIGEDFNLQLGGRDFTHMNLEFFALVVELDEIFEIELLQLERRSSEVEHRQLGCKLRVRRPGEGPLATDPVIIDEPVIRGKLYGVHIGVRSLQRLLADQGRLHRQARAGILVSVVLLHIRPQHLASELVGRQRKGDAILVRIQLQRLVVPLQV